MFHRIGEPALKPTLDNTIALCTILNNPQEKFKSIHIAGTNGKGSSSHMIASVLQEAGYKTGLYTSPHLKNFTERIRINGKEISEKKVVDFVRENKIHFERIQPSFFEMTVALAFDYFAEEKIDVAVVEVGLGGRLDSTNIIQPILSLITNISFDHEKILGNTLTSIAFEKAGIIKKSVPVVVSEFQEEVQEVFEKKAKMEEAKLINASKIYSITNPTFKKGKFQTDVLKEGKSFYSNLEIGLPGIYQAHNVIGVLATMDQLKDQGFKLDEKSIREGLQKVVSNTGLKGRWQALNLNPLTICDTGHNEAGIKYVVEQLKTLTFHKLHFVLGTVNDKSIEKIVKLLPKEAHYYFCKPNIPRGLDANLLQQEAARFNLKGEAYSSVESAIEAASQNAQLEDLIFIGGSNFVVAEIPNL
jgi:dihydrofolate synthase/folylpolyglutamate synthase